MFYEPELMVYLWILPVIGMVILPALWTITCMLYRSLERSRLSDVSGFLDLNTYTPDDSSQQERRKQNRVLIDGPKASVAGQVKCCQTIVVNISPRGLCLREVPQKINKEAGDKLKVVFRTRERDYRMYVRPKWKKLEERGNVIGTEIVNIPRGWEKFVNEFYQGAAEAA